MKQDIPNLIINLDERLERSFKDDDKYYTYFVEKRSRSSSKRKYYKTSNDKTFGIEGKEFQGTYWGIVYELLASRIKHIIGIGNKHEYVGYQSVLCRRKERDLLSSSVFDSLFWDIPQKPDKKNDIFKCSWFEKLNSYVSQAVTPSVMFFDDEQHYDYDVVPAFIFVSVNNTDAFLDRKFESFCENNRIRVLLFEKEDRISFKKLFLPSDERNRTEYFKQKFHLDEEKEIDKVLNYVNFAYDTVEILRREDNKSEPFNLGVAFVPACRQNEVKTALFSPFVVPSVNEKELECVFRRMEMLIRHVGLPIDRQVFALHTHKRESEKNDLLAKAIMESCAKSESVGPLLRLFIGYIKENLRPFYQSLCFLDFSISHFKKPDGFGIVLFPGVKSEKTNEKDMQKVNSQTDYFTYEKGGEVWRCISGQAEKCYELGKKFTKENYSVGKAPEFSNKKTFDSFVSHFSHFSHEKKSKISFRIGRTDVSASSDNSTGTSCSTSFVYSMLDGESADTRHQGEFCLCGAALTAPASYTKTTANNRKHNFSKNWKAFQNLFYEDGDFQKRMFRYSANKQPMKAFAGVPFFDNKGKLYATLFFGLSPEKENDENDWEKRIGTFIESISKDIIVPLHEMIEQETKAYYKGISQVGEMFGHEVIKGLMFANNIFGNEQFDSSFCAEVAHVTSLYAAIMTPSNSLNSYLRKLDFDKIKRLAWRIFLLRSIFPDDVGLRKVPTSAYENLWNYFGSDDLNSSSASGAADSSRLAVKLVDLSDRTKTVGQKNMVSIKTPPILVKIMLILLHNAFEHSLGIYKSNKGADNLFPLLYHLFPEEKKEGASYNMELNNARVQCEIQKDSMFTDDSTSRINIYALTVRNNFKADYYHEPAKEIFKNNEEDKHWGTFQTIEALLCIKFDEQYSRPDFIQIINGEDEFSATITLKMKDGEQ